MTDSITIYMDTVLLNLSTIVTDANCSNSFDGSIDLAATGSVSGVTYSWSNLDTTQDLNNILSGTYYVQVFDSMSCPAYDTVFVGYNNTAPNVTLSFVNNVVCEDANSIFLSGESPTGGVWSGTGVTGNNFNPSTAGIGTHTITYVFIDGNGCSNSATDDIQVDDCSGISENEKVSFSVYPNPTLGLFTITSEYTNGNAIIRDAIGKVVYSTNFTSEKIAIDISNVERGIYFIQVENSRLLKIIKE